MTDRVIQNTGRYYNIHYCLLENRPGLLPNRPVSTGTCFPRGGAFATKIHVMCIFFLYVIVPSVHVLRSFFLHTPTILFKDPPPCVSNPVDFICCPVGYKYQEMNICWQLQPDRSSYNLVFQGCTPVGSKCIMITQCKYQKHTHSFYLTSWETNGTDCKLHHNKYELSYTWWRTFFKKRSSSSQYL